MLSNAKIMRQAERTLKRTKPYLENRSGSNAPESNFQLDYVLVKKYKSTPAASIAYAHYMDEIIKFDPLRETAEAESVWDWAFNIDTDLFFHLEDGYDLIGMSLTAHAAAWEEISECHHDGIEYAKGMQQYLNYCKRNRITMELLRAKCRYDGMDVMTLYDKTAFREIHTKSKER